MSKIKALWKDRDNQYKYFKWLMFYSKPYFWRIVLMMTFSISGTVLSLWMVTVSKTIIDRGVAVCGGDNGHAMTIIGWDDNYDKNNFNISDNNGPKNNGAFLVKDSKLDKLWYVSYEDPTLARINKNYAFVTVENNTNYKKQYYYDLYGTIGNQSSRNIQGCANCFTMDEDGFLSALVSLHMKILIIL